MSSAAPTRRSAFGLAHARRHPLADAQGVDVDDDPAEVIVEAVAAVRDALGLSSRLRDVDVPEPEAFPDVAEYNIEDSIMTNAPAGLDPTAEEIEAVLRAAY